MSNDNEKENENELQLYFKNDATKFTSKKKELIYDTDKNKYFLLDKDINKIFPSNIFGKKKIKISNSNLGKLSYKERLKKDLIEKMEHKIDEYLYAPKNKYFEGFSQIPRRLKKPLFNLKNNNSIKNNKIIQSKLDILNFIRNKDSTSIDNKYKDISSRNIKKNEPKVKSLNYYTNSVSDIINRKKRKRNTKRVIKIINSSLSSVNLTVDQKKLLNKFKNNILNNSNNKLEYPKKIFNFKYQINSNVMFINPTKHSQPIHDAEINLKTYHILYNTINKNEITKLKENRNYEINKIIYDRFYRPSSVTNIRSENVIFSPEKYKFEKCGTKRYDTEENYKDNNINNKYKVHTLGNIKKENDNESRHINGYVKPLKKHIIITKKGNPKYISGKEVYKKDMDLLKLVNPEKLKIEEIENEKRINYLKRKIEKDRQIRILKIKNIRGKSSRLNSAFSNNLAKDSNEYIE